MQPVVASSARYALDEWLRRLFVADFGAGLARDLSQVVSEPIFDVAWLVEALRDEGFDSILGGGSTERSDAGVPSGAEFDIRRQAGIDEALGLGDRPFVEPGDPGRERFYECVEIGIGQGAIDVAVGFGLLCSDVFRAQQHLEGAVAADELGQSGHGAAAGDHPDAHLPLRDDGLLAAGETHVAGERDLAAVAGRAAANEGDGGDWQARQTHEKVRPGRQARGTGRHGGQVLELGHEIGVIQEVVVDRAVEDHDPDLLVGLESVDDFLELTDHLRAHDVESAGCRS